MLTTVSVQNVHRMACKVNVGVYTVASYIAELRMCAYGACMLLDIILMIMSPGNVMISKMVNQKQQSLLYMYVHVT